MNNGRARYVWDYDLTQEQFDTMLEGRYENGPLNRDWAAVRLIEWAPYAEMIRRIGYKALVENWPRWRSRLRSEQQKRSLDFVVEWLPEHHPELLGSSARVKMTKEQFVGTWQLVCSEFRCSDGTVIYPYGQDASGNLYYDAAGNMAVQLMRSDRPLFAAGDRQQGTPEEIKAAFEGYLAYFGHYEVDEQEKIVIHHVASCTFPNWIDQPQKRFFAFADNQLTLSTPPLRVGDQLSLVYCVGNAYYDDSRPRYAASRQVTCQDPQ